MASTPEQVSITEEQERALVLYGQAAQNLLLNQFSIRSALEISDRYYMRETDFDPDNIRATLANRLGNKKHYRNITVPVVMPQVESALGYLVNVFATGLPIFGVAGDPSTEGAAQQMETILAENSIRGRWARELTMFFRDGLKYNLHALECDWEQCTNATVVTDASAPNSAKPKNVLWAGNVVRRMDPYNMFFDPRVHPAEIHEKGEFAGYIKLFSRIQLKEYINNLFNKVDKATVKRAFESGPPPGATASNITPYLYYVPQLNPFPTIAPQNVNGTTFDWMNWVTAAGSKNANGIRYTNVYQVTKMYARILPSDFGFKVPSENTPQVWKFIIVNGSVVLLAERLTNAHNYIPMFFGQPIEDGLDYQTKSYAQNVMDLQDIASTAWNGWIASKRRLIGDRVLYDPSKIREKDINSTDPAAKIPVRPSAYGKPLGEAVYQFPYHDEQTNSLVVGANAVVGMANLVNGQNPAQQGQFVKGNKTRSEYDDVMGHGNDHNQIMGIAIEMQVFTPMKEVLKLNTLQYQPEGVIYNVAQNKQVKIDPVELRKQAVHFKVSDGMTPTEKELSTDEFTTALQAMAANPQLGAGYNVGDIFSYLMSVRGADLTPFKKSPAQVQYEQQLQAWQQAAALAAQKGTPFSSPQPQPSAQLQQEMQAKQSGVHAASPEGTALESTQGGGQ